MIKVWLKKILHHSIKLIVLLFSLRICAKKALLILKMKFSLFFFPSLLLSVLFFPSCTFSNRLKLFRLSFKFSNELFFLSCRIFFSLSLFFLPCLKIKWNIKEENGLISRMASRTNEALKRGTEHTVQQYIYIYVCRRKETKIRKNFAPLCTFVWD